MTLDYNSLIGTDLITHAKKTLTNEEVIKYYIDDTYGWSSYYKYVEIDGDRLTYLDKVDYFKVRPEEQYKNLIKNTFKRLDRLIDLDFEETLDINNSSINIYQINYSSDFKPNAVGQAISKSSINKNWSDIFWKDSLLSGSININSNANTIVHEIAHTLGLSHPYGQPRDSRWTSEDTIMSYNIGPSGWSDWFSEADLNALISIWGRENDNGIITLKESSSSYKYKQTALGQYFINTNTGYENITNINTLNFSDKSLDVKKDIINVFNLIKGVDDITGKVYRLYNAAFARFPDYDGLNYWIEKNKYGPDNFRITAESFVISDEFNTLNGTNLPDEKYVENLYSNVLNRSPDTLGFNYWLNQLSQGIENRSELLIGFSESLENKLIFYAETAFL